MGSVTTEAMTAAVDTTTATKAMRLIWRCSSVSFNCSIETALTESSAALGRTPRLMYRRPDRQGGQAGPSRLPSRAGPPRAATPPARCAHFRSSSLSMSISLLEERGEAKKNHFYILSSGTFKHFQSIFQQRKYNYEQMVHYSTRINVLERRRGIRNRCLNLLGSSRDPHQLSLSFNPHNVHGVSLFVQSLCRRVDYSLKDFLTTVPSV